MTTRTQFVSIAVRVDYTSAIFTSVIFNALPQKTSVVKVLTVLDLHGNSTEKKYKHLSMIAKGVLKSV